MASDIANVLLVLGLSGWVHPLDVAELSLVYTIPIMLFFSITLLHSIRSDWRLGRGQGALPLAAYVHFLVVAFVQGRG
jgi:cation:H+ antiporter